MDDAVELIRDFLNAGAQPVDKPRELAERLARLTRQIRNAVLAMFSTGDASAVFDANERFLGGDADTRFEARIVCRHVRSNDSVWLVRRAD